MGACASADQLVSSLGVWNDGIIPGILTSESIASDVYQQNLDFLLQHREIDIEEMDSAFINSKGFGGNNATAAILAPHIVQKMLVKKHGKTAMRTYRAANEQVQERVRAYDDSMLRGENSTIYNFGAGVIQGEELGISSNQISIPGQKNKISLQLKNPYEDFF